MVVVLNSEKKRSDEEGFPPLQLPQSGPCTKSMPSARRQKLRNFP